MKLHLFTNQGSKNPKTLQKIKCLYLFIFANPEYILLLYSSMNYHTDLITTQRKYIQL